MMDKSTKSWSLCDGAPPLQGHPILSFGFKKQYNTDMDFDWQVMEQKFCLAYQGLLDNCNDVEVTEAKVQAAQAPLNQGIRRPEAQDWEWMRRYLGKVPVETVRNTFKHTTQIGTLSPSSHL